MKKLWQKWFWDWIISDFKTVEDLRAVYQYFWYSFWIHEDIEPPNLFEVRYGLWLNLARENVQMVYMSLKVESN